MEFPYVWIYNYPDKLTMVLVYLTTKLGDFGQGQMLMCIFQDHGLHMGYPLLN